MKGDQLNTEGLKLLNIDDQTINFDDFILDKNDTYFSKVF